MTEPDFAGSLPCGAFWHDLFDQVALDGPAPRTEHQQGCPHCRAGLAELDRLWRPVRGLADEKVSAPPDFTRTLMTRLHELAAAPWHLVIAAERGVTRIASRVLGTIARKAAAQVPGVHAALGRSTGPAAAAATESATRRHSARGSAVGVAGQTAVIDLAIAVEYGTSIPDTSQQVRDIVARHLREHAGVEDAEIHLTIDDVLYDPDTPSRQA